MNNKEHEIEVLRELDRRIHELYSGYAKEDDDDVRREMRKEWKRLVKEYEQVARYNPYRSNL